MHNGQLKPGYNVQIMVESEYIVGMGIFSNPTDTKTLIPFMERVYACTHRRIQKLISDAGYESEENYSYLNLLEHVAEQLLHAVHDVRCAREFLAVHEFSQ